jgi:hypothetical protein
MSCNRSRTFVLAPLPNSTSAAPSGTKRAIRVALSARIPNSVRVG